MPRTTQNALSATQPYTRTAKLLHWGMAALILGMLAVGFYMEDMAFSPLKFQIIQLHKSVGITILMLVALRLLWRFTYPAPMLPADMPRWQKAAAHASHTLLYVLMFAMPLSGYLMSDAAGYHPSWFGLNVPILLNPDPALAQTLNQAHEFIAYAIIALLSVHVGGALYHHFILKDTILRRMLPALLVACLGSTLFAPGAFATGWTIDPTVSKLSWSVPFNNQPVRGGFETWNAAITFDPANLKAASLNVTVNLASVGSADANRDTTLKGPDFFNVSQSPTATFTSTNITATSQANGSTYVAAGNLTLGGITKPVAVPFTLEINGTKATANGKLQLSRSAFGIGKGQWASASEIADLVTVSFIISANAAPSATNAK